MNLTSNKTNLSVEAEVSKLVRTYVLLVGLGVTVCISNSLILIVVIKSRKFLLFGYLAAGDGLVGLGAVIGGSTYIYYVINGTYYDLIPRKQCMSFIPIHILALAYFWIAFAMVNICAERLAAVGVPAWYKLSWNKDLERRNIFVSTAAAFACFLGGPFFLLNDELILRQCSMAHSFGRIYMGFVEAVQIIVGLATAVSNIFVAVLAKRQHAGLNVQANDHYIARQKRLTNAVAAMVATSTSKEALIRMKNSDNFEKSLKKMEMKKHTVYAPSNHTVVTINVSGVRYQTYVETLERFPDTLLGNPLKRLPFLNPKNGEYFFDHHRGAFSAILYFYQSGGYLKRPPHIPADVFVEEINFFELGEEVIQGFWRAEGYRKPKEMVLPNNLIQRKIWLLMEYPDSSVYARTMAFFSIAVILLSTCCFCIETLPEFRHKYDPEDVGVVESRMQNHTLQNVTVYKEVILNRWDNPFFVIETICIIWFTIELVVRFLVCPAKCDFIQGVLNWVDLIAIAPFFINLVITGSILSLAVLRVFRLVRVFRIFKLSRHSRGLQILGLTFRASARELCLLLFFLGIAVVLFASAIYFAENGREDTMFTSIPEGFWYCIVTMTTIGYGDMFPVGAIGKILGSICALIGVLVVALPVPVIVENFKHFYRQETRLALMNYAKEADAAAKLITYKRSLQT